MKKAIIISTTILSGMMILDSANVGHALTMFLFAGLIPGTNIAISASDALVLFAMSIGFVIARLTSRFTLPLLDHFPIRRHA